MRDVLSERPRLFWQLWVTVENMPKELCVLMPFQNIIVIFPSDCMFWAFEEIVAVQNDAGLEFPSLKNKTKLSATAAR